MPLYFGQSTGILFKTLPYVLLRALVYVGFGIALMIYFVLVYFLGQGAAVLHEYARVGVWILVPWALTSMICVYLKASAGKIPDPGWQDKLGAISSKFRKIQEQAAAAPTSPTLAPAL